MAAVEKKELTPEIHPDPDAVLSKLLELHGAARAEIRKAGPEWLKDRIKGLPEAARQSIIEYDKLLAEVQDEQVYAKLIEREIARFEQTYMDKRFTVENGERLLKDEYGKEKALEWIKELLDEKPKAEDLKKIARLSFDANGLKAVNDLSGSHENGTEYLRRVAEVFFRKEGPARERMKELGVHEVLPVTGGGDEYGVLLKSREPITAEALSEIVGLYEEEISRLDVSDLVDFEDTKTKLRFLGISPERFDKMNKAERADALAKLKMPPSFKMRASISGGEATLYDGLLFALRDTRGGKRLTMDDAYEKAIAKMMGGLWDSADQTANDSKKRYKEGLRTSESAEDRFNSQVILRTEEARILEDRLREMEDAVRRFDVLREEIKSVRKIEGLSEESYFRTLENILKRYV